MGEATSALLLGESEIDRVESLLRELGVSFDRVHAPRSAMQLPMPSQLLVVSGACVPRLPTLLSEDPTDAEPVRVCIHSQDFLPLRERLRTLGFHYLVQTALDETSTRVLFTQLLHPTAQKRRSVRLPLGGEVEYRASSASGTAKLADLSVHGCRLSGVEELSLDESAAVLLPAALGGGKPLALQGRVKRCDPATDRTPPCAVVRFGLLDDDARERLDRLVRGELIGTRVTPLADPPLFANRGAGSARADGDLPLERRREDRHPYQGRVDVLELAGSAGGALGRDLSLDGVRISGGPRLKPGMKLTLALYGGHGAEPAVVEAEVVRAGAEESVLVFERLTDAQQERLAELIAEPPALEALEADAAGGRVLAAQIVDPS